MQIRWRGLELPSRVIHDDTVSSDSYGRFVIEPFEQGFGTTIGNSLRRVLLSSLEGAAVSSVKIAGVSHEFTSIEGVLEDVTDIVLNIKGIRVAMTGEAPRTMRLRRDKAGEVRAGEFVCDPSVKIVNPDHLIATLTTDVPLEIEAVVRTGRGYATASDNRRPDQELGVIPIDSIFSPVLRVRFRTEAMRVGQRTNFDRLILEVWTNAAVLPEDALVEAGLILRRHLSPFVMYHEMGEAKTQRMQPKTESYDSADLGASELLNRPIAVLNLSVRSGNCLDAARVTTVGELVRLCESELLRFRSFGRTSLHEVQRKLAEFGLSLRSSDEGSSSGTAGGIDMFDGGETGNPGASDAASADSSSTTQRTAADSSLGSGSEQASAFTMPD